MVYYRTQLGGVSMFSAVQLQDMRLHVCILKVAVPYKPAIFSPQSCFIVKVDEFRAERYDCTGQKKRFFNWIVQLYEPELTFFP